MKNIIFSEKILLLSVFIISTIFFFAPLGATKTTEAYQAGGGATPGGCSIVDFQLNPSLILSWELSPQCTSDSVSSPVTGTISPSTDGFNMQAITGLANVVAQTQSTTYTLTAYDSEGNSTTATAVYGGAQHIGCNISSYSVTGSNNNYAVTVNFPSTDGSGIPCFIYANGVKVTSWNGSTFGYTVSQSNSSELQLSAQSSTGGYTVAYLSLPPYVQTGNPPTVTLSASPISVSSGGSSTLSWNVTGSPTYCSASNDQGNIYWNGSVATSSGSSQTVSNITSSSSSITFSITCSNMYGSSSPSTVIVTVISMSNPPDLIASAPSPITATTNVAQTFSSTITNQGTGSTLTGFTNLFQTSASPSGTSPTDYAVPGMSALAASGTATTSKSITFTSAGISYIRACADKSSAGDATGTIAESNENNNCSAWTAVTVTNGATPVVTISVNPTSGTAPVTPTLTWSATNSPTSCTATGSWSGTKATSGTNVSQATLSSAATYQYNLSCTNSNGTGSASTATIVVSNGASPSGPDLVANAPSPSSATVGTALTFSSLITNQGDTTTGSSFNNFFQVSPDQVNNTDLSPTSMSALGAGASSNATSPSYTFNSTGTYYVRACADETSSAGGGVITESNENNNCSSWTTVSVGVANGGSISVNLTASPNPTGYAQQSMLTWTVHNANWCYTYNDGGDYNFSGNYWYSGDPHITDGQHQQVTSAIYQATTYTLNCYDNYGGFQSSSVYITLGAMVPPTVTISASPTTVTSGGNTTLTWSAYNTPRCISQSNPGNGQFLGSWYYYPDGTPQTVPITGLTQTTDFSMNCVYQDYSNTVAPDVLVSVVAPDLTAASPTPTSATIGVPVNFTSTISNIGTASTGTAFNNYFELATAAGGAGTTSDLTYTSMSALGAGATGTATSPAKTFSAGACTSGVCSVRACADKSFTGDTGVINESNENNNCSAWTNVAVSAPVATGTISATSCIILSGASNCNSAVTWNTVNPVGTSTVTNTSGATVATANSGSAVPEVVKYNSETFYLSNNGNSLGLINVFSTCASGTSWNGTVCAENGGGGISSCSNGATNPPLCTLGGGGGCEDGATNPPTCTLNGGGTCLNGASNPPLCTLDVNGVCLNGATNPPICTIDTNGKCLDGATNPPTCYNKAPLFKEN